MKIYQKTIAILLLAGIASASSANTIEYDVTAEKTQIQLYVEKAVAGKVGAYVYSNQSKGWGEVHTGITYAPVNYIQVSAGIGKETNGNRVACSVWAGKGKFSGIYFAENGGSGPWTKSVIKYAVSPKASLGYTKKSFAGEGLYAECKLNSSITLKVSGFDKFKATEIGLNIAF